MGNEPTDSGKSGAEPPVHVHSDGESQTSPPLSEAQARDVVRDVILQLAPEELPVFDSVADAWLADDQRRRRSGKAPGAAVGFGVETLLLTELAFPIITSALGEVLGDVAKDRVRDRMRRLVRRPATKADGRLAGAGAEKISENPAHDLLTGQQARAVGDACERHARTLGMSPAKAKLLADAVLGSLLRRGGN
jgi:hypothetical protein